MSDTDMAFIARWPCGHVYMATVDRPETRRDAAKDVAAAMRHGHVVERMTVAEAREAFKLTPLPHRDGDCREPEPKKAGKRRAAQAVQGVLIEAST